MPNVIVVAILQAKPGSEETALAVLTETLEATHAEEGCRTYALHVSTQDPTQFVLVERWDDQEALDGHFGQPHMAKLAGAAGDLLAAPPTVVFTEAIALGDPAKGTLAGA